MKTNIWGQAGKGLVKVNGSPLGLVQPEILRFKVRVWLELPSLMCCLQQRREYPDPFALTRSMSLSSSSASTNSPTSTSVSG